MTTEQKVAALETAGAHVARMGEDALVYVVPRCQISEALRVLKSAGLVPADAPLVYA